MLVRNLVLMSLSLFAVVSVAAERPYTQAGVVNTVAQDGNRIIVSDYPYRVAPDVIVHRDGYESVGLRGMESGQRIGFNTERKDGQRYIVEVWTLDELPRDRRLYKR